MSNECIFTVLVESASILTSDRNAYVKLSDLASTQHTPVIKRNPSPAWKQQFTIRLDSSSSKLTLSVKHKTSIPFSQNHCLGSVELSRDELLENCINDQPCTFNLMTVSNTIPLNDSQSITIRLLNRISNTAIANAVAEAGKAVKAAELGILDHSPVGKVIDGIGDLSSTQSDSASALSGLVSKLDILASILDDASKIHPYLNGAWQITSALYKVLKGQMERDASVVRLLSTMEMTFSFVTDISSIPGKIKHLENTILVGLRQCTECATFVREYTGHGFSSRLFRQTFSDVDGTISRFITNLNLLKSSLDSDLNLQKSFVSTNTFKDVHWLAINERLKLLQPTKMTMFGRSLCMPDTRQKLLNSIVDWVTAPSPAQNILWLQGQAGSGKSAVANTIGAYFENLRRLGAFLYFERPTLIDPESLLCTLTFYLARFDPMLAELISTAIDQNPSIAERLVDVQYAELLQQPLSTYAAKYATGPILVVIDALDECGEAKSRKDLLRLFATSFAKLPPVFRFLVTARADEYVYASLAAQSHINVMEIDISDADGEEDICRFLHARMEEIGWEKFQLTASSSPARATIDALVQRSSGLFIWASTLMLLLEDAHNPQRKLKAFLDLEQHATAEGGLHNLYANALKSQGKWTDDDFVKEYRSVLGCIIASKTPLSNLVIDSLLGDVNCLNILQRFRCVFRWSLGQPVHMLHASFADYLTSSERCGNQPWYIDRATANEEFLMRCFHVMRTSLKFNICNLESSYLLNDDVPHLSERVQKMIPEHLAYSCCHWAEHLHGTSPSPVVADCIKQLIKKQFLHYLEVLSLINSVPVSAMKVVAGWARGENNQLKLLALDAFHFICMFLRPMSQSVPHIYLSAIPFSPAKSSFASHHAANYHHLTVEIGQVDIWPLSQVFEGHSGSVFSVAFSPNGKKIVSGSSDNSVRVWDSETGQDVMGPLEGHSNIVQSVTFSPDGRKIISGSFDNSVRVWDAETGQEVMGPLEGHSDSVTSVAFSPNGRNTVSGSWDHSVRVWDAETGQEVMEPLKGHSDVVKSVAFSPDGRNIVSGPVDNSVRTWDAETGQEVMGPLEGHSSSVKSVAFSPDGRKIVSGSLDMSVRVWDTETGQEVMEPLEGHSSSVHSVAFSPDGRRIVSGSWDHSVRVWDAETGQDVMGPLEHHLAGVTSVAFSPDGRKIVSGSSDKSVQVWDAMTGQEVMGPLEGHSNLVTSEAFSPDGRKIVSVSFDNSVQVWDADTVQKMGPLKGHSDGVESVAFSPDGRKIVSGSINN